MKTKIEDNKLSKLAAELIIECHIQGYKEAEDLIFSFFTKCANELDFGNDSPKNVVIELLKIAKENSAIHLDRYKENKDIT